MSKNRTAFDSLNVIAPCTTWGQKALSFCDLLYGTVNLPKTTVQDELLRGRMYKFNGMSCNGLHTKAAVRIQFNMRASFC